MIDFPKCEGCLLDGKCELQESEILEKECGDTTKDCNQKLVSHWQSHIPADKQ
jgi:hypothetical protein